MQHRDGDNKQCDPEDILSESLETIYDHPQVAFASAGSLFCYEYAPDDSNSDLSSSSITLKIPDTQPANWALHVSSIWVAALYIANHLGSLSLDRHIRAAALHGRATLRVLELGAGAGLPGILIAKRFTTVDVVSSDYPDEHLIRILAENIELNNVASRCRAVAHAWGQDPSVLFASHSHDVTAVDTDGFDVILAADTLWNSEMHHCFLATLCGTLRRSPPARIYLVAGFHTGRYTVESFLKLVVGVGIEVEEAIEREVHGDGSRPWDVNRAETEDEAERRRWVVWISLKWPKSAITE